MLKDAHRTTAPCAYIDALPPGIFERARAAREEREESAHVADLKAQVKCALQEAEKLRADGFEMAAFSHEQDIAPRMRRLIEMGAF